MGGTLAKEILLALLGAVAAVFAIYAARDGQNGTAAEGERHEPVWPSAFHLAVGFVTDFLDTLGIGSFATTTTLFRLGRRVDDRLVPGTLNVGHTLPTVAQAFIYVTIVRVEMSTLVVLILASVAGAWIGSGRVATWSRRKVRIAMGSALLVAAAIMAFRALGWFPGGGQRLGLTPILLAGGAAGNFLLGALMTAGIGLYAPCMILVSLLGMNPTTAFPIMMGSCAFLMPASSSRFVRHRAYDRRAALGLTLGGIPAVLVAAFVVKSLPLDVVRWLVVAVVIYTAGTLLIAARKEG